MRKNTFIVLGLMLLIVSSIASTTTQPSRTDVLKAEWNRTLCIALRVLQILAVGVAALLIMVAGLKYMSSEDVYDRNEAKNMIIRVLCLLAVIAVSVQVVNYLVSGSNIGALDIDSCSELFPATTRVVTPTSVPTTGPTTTTNGTTTTVASTTSSTTTTTLGSCDDPNNPYSIYGTKNPCQKGDLHRTCLVDIASLNPIGPANGIPDLDDILGTGFTKCCCDQGYANCCK
ncbi:MAG: hypothetical protein WAX07_03330 [Candidatus Altiarchaeia archaeon]|jgi:uncharacterized membrane protein YidH (DUF202 family)